jgi:nitroreductase
LGDGPLLRGDVAIVPIIDSTNFELWKEDACVASTYILLAAEYFGIGACWIYMDGRNGKNKSGSEEIKDLLGIPSKCKILNCVSLGKKKKEQKIK